MAVEQCLEKLGEQEPLPIDQLKTIEKVGKGGRLNPESAVATQSGGVSEFESGVEHSSSLSELSQTWIEEVLTELVEKVLDEYTPPKRCAAEQTTVGADIAQSAQVKLDTETVQALLTDIEITTETTELDYKIMINTGAELPEFVDYTKAKSFNGIKLSVAELYAGGSTTAVALVLEGYGLDALFSVEFNETQRKIGHHNLSVLHQLFPERVSAEVVDNMHCGPNDVRELTAENLAGRDIITAGFPCQDMTRANRKRKGFKGARSGQYYALEKLLKRVIKLEPSVTILLENVNFKETFPEDYARVCMAWGRGVIRDAADVSFQHRLRAWWGYNIKILSGVKVKGLELRQVLEPEHKPRPAQYTDKHPSSCYNIKGEPQVKFVTQLTINDTYNVRSGDALVVNREQEDLVRPWTCELARCAGWWDCFIASAPVSAEAKVFCLGNSQDLNEVRNIFRKWIPCKTQESRHTHTPNSKHLKVGPQPLPPSVSESEKKSEVPGKLQLADGFQDAVNVDEKGGLEESELTGNIGHHFIDNNPYSILTDLDDDEWDSQEEGDHWEHTPDCLKGRAGEMLYRVAAQIRKHFPRKGFSKREPARPQDCITAADWKYLLAYKLPLIMHIPVPKIQSVKSKAEWNCISLKRLRFQGSKEQYVVIRDVSNQRRVLIMHVPPKGLTDKQMQEHAEQQATFHDNEHGILEKGIRIKFNNWKTLDLTDVQLQRLEKGQELLLHYTPPAFGKKNYESSWEYEGMTRKELLRYKDKGWIEGPLHYRPWLVMPLGAVYKPDTGKYRLVLDGTASGLNKAMSELWCRYDMLSDALPHISPNDWLSKLDFADAFFHWAYRQSDCDMLGVQCPDTGEFYRFRFTFFGSKQAPAVQQAWTHTLKRLVNTHGLKYCTPNSPEADYNSFAMVGGFVDDCVQRHDSSLTLEQAESQFHSVVKFLCEDLGVEVKRSKDITPTTAVDYTGIMIDTVEQTAFITPERRVKYRENIEEFLQSHKVGDQVNRRELASVIGKLQWAAQVVSGGQLKLTRCYWCRDLFSDEQLAMYGSTKDKWGKNVTVNFTSEAYEDLKWWVDTLANDIKTKIYLSRHPLTSGFWKGLVNEDDAFLDRTSETEEGIIVFTTDASGFGGGGWWKHERLHKFYTVSEGPKFRSSNWREMDMVKSSLEHWGEQWRGQRVLVRCDNSVTVSSIQKGRVKVRTLHTLFSQLLAVCEKYNINLAARHIPGVANGLADRISRWKPGRDTSDWQLDHDLVKKYASQTGQFDVDACADPLGKNAHVHRFWSSLDSCLERSWSGLHVWCNPDFDMISEVVAHFKKSFAEDPTHTSVCFCVPVWFSQKYWRQLKGFRVLDYFPEGSDVFTSPDYWRQNSESPYPDARVFRGGTKWGTVVLYHPPATVHRDERRLGESGQNTTSSGWLQGVPVLSGDQLRDTLLLREMSKTCL